MINKVPGDYDEKFEGLKAFYGFMMGHPGKKLNFMGNEFAQFIEWNYAQQLDWFLLDYPRHRTFQSLSRISTISILKTRPCGNSIARTTASNG